MSLLYPWCNWLLLNRNQYFLTDKCWRLRSSFHTKNQNLNCFFTYSSKNSSKYEYAAILKKNLL